MTNDELAALADAISSYQQADMDGIMVLVSRQACDEAAAALRQAAERIAELEAILRDALDGGWKTQDLQIRWRKLAEEAMKDKP